MNAALWNERAAKMSDEEYSVNDHFKGKEKSLRELYNQLIATVGEFGPVSQEPKKTSIHLVNHTALAGVQVRKDYLLLNLKSDHPLKSRRFHKNERLSAKRFHQELRIESSDDLDDELRGWLKEAYELSG